MDTARSDSTNSQFSVAGQRLTDNNTTLDGLTFEASRLTAPEPLLKTEWIKKTAFVVPYGTIYFNAFTNTGAVNNQDVKSIEHFRELMGAAEKGRIVALLVRRAGNSLYIPFRSDAN